MRISCAGFPTKMPYEDFVDHFWNLVPELLSQPDLDDRALSKGIVAKGDLEGYQAGNTKVITFSPVKLFFMYLIRDELNVGSIELIVKY